ncbi:MAG: hypothetical protein AAGB13_01020 [Cyanobacteria bacterium P01_F01_bin.33]
MIVIQLLAVYLLSCLSIRAKNCWQLLTGILTDNNYPKQQGWFALAAIGDRSYAGEAAKLAARDIQE